MTTCSVFDPTIPIGLFEKDAFFELPSNTCCDMKCRARSSSPIVYVRVVKDIWLTFAFWQTSKTTPTESQLVPFTTCAATRLTDWLTGWLAGWLTDWLTGVWSQTTACRIVRLFVPQAECACCRNHVTYLLKKYLRVWYAVYVHHVMFGTRCTCIMLWCLVRGVRASCCDVWYTVYVHYVIMFGTRCTCIMFSVCFGMRCRCILSCCLVHSICAYVLFGAQCMCTMSWCLVHSVCAPCRAVGTVYVHRIVLFGTQCMCTVSWCLVHSGCAAYRAVGTLCVRFILSCFLIKTTVRGREWQVTHLLL
jgi:hypothetical protein